MTHARKIIQIAVEATSFEETTEYGVRLPKTDSTLYALTDDGLVWYTKGSSPTINKGWDLLVPIPQTPLDEIQFPLTDAQRRAQYSGGEDW